MIKSCLRILIVSFSLCSFAQENPKIDSLQLVLKQQYQDLSKIDTTAVKLLHKISVAYHTVNKDSAINYTQKAIAAAQKIGYQKGEAIALNYWGRLLYFIGDYPTAIEKYQLALTLNKRIQNKKGILTNNHNIGQGYLLLNNYVKSLHYFNKALDEAQQIKDYISISDTYNNLAILYGKQNKNVIQLQYYKKGLKVIKKDTSASAQNRREIINFNLALCYKDQKQYQKALDYFQDFYQTELQKSPHDVAYIERAIGKTQTGLKNYKKAVKYLNLAINTFEQNNEKSNLADCYREIAEAYFEQKKYTKAIAFTLKGLKISEEIGELESVKFAHENLAKYYQTLHDYKNAYKHQYFFKKVSDSIFNTNIDREITQIQHQYELEKQDEKFKSEQKYKDEIIKKETKNKNLLLYGLVVSLLLFGSLIYGINKSLKNTKKEKKIIQNALNEKEILLKEIHHRVKNNLQVISSILSIQSQSITDKNTLLMVEEGQRRIQAMSLIHQSLYQSENITQIDVKLYLNELVAYLSDLFDGNQKNIKTTIDADEVYFDFDTAIPLGLILNELITNIYKYAFKNVNEGNICIHITTQNKLDYQLEVCNDGNPLPEDFDITKTSSFGIKLIHILSRQLRGKLKNESTPTKTIFIVDFKDLKAYNNTKKTS